MVPVRRSRTLTPNASWPQPSRRRLHVVGVAVKRPRSIAPMGTSRRRPARTTTGVTFTSLRAVVTNGVYGKRSVALAEASSGSMRGVVMANDADADASSDSEAACRTTPSSASACTCRCPNSTAVSTIAPFARRDGQRCGAAGRDAPVRVGAFEVDVRPVPARRRRGCSAVMRTRYARRGGGCDGRRRRRRQRRQLDGIAPHEQQRRVHVASSAVSQQIASHSASALAASSPAATRRAARRRCTMHHLLTNPLSTLPTAAEESPTGPRDASAGRRFRES